MPDPKCPICGTDRAPYSPCPNANCWSRGGDDMSELEQLYRGEPDLKPKPDPIEVQVRIDQPTAEHTSASLRAISREINDRTFTPAKSRFHDGGVIPKGTRPPDISVACEAFGERQTKKGTVTEPRQEITTGDPQFDPRKPVWINGYRFDPEEKP